MMTGCLWLSSSIYLNIPLHEINKSLTQLATGRQLRLCSSSSSVLQSGHQLEAVSPWVGTTNNSDTREYMGPIGEPQHLALSYLAHVCGSRTGHQHLGQVWCHCGGSYLLPVHRQSGWQQAPLSKEQEAPGSSHFHHLKPT